MLYKILRVVITILMKFFYKIEVVNKELLENPPYILAGNHTSNLDAFLLISSNKNKIRFLAKKELFNPILKPILLKMGVIKVDRQKKNKEAIDTSIDALKNNEIICIFPEGTINRTKDTILPFKHGAVSIAKKTNKRIVPFIIIGKYKLFRKSIKIKFLNPIFINDELNIENERLMNIIKENLKNENLV